MSKKVVKIYGGAGTGKTTFMVSKLKELLDMGILASDIGFFSFSRKAIDEVLERLPKIDKDKNNFRTLDSFIFRELRAEQKRFIRPKNNTEEDLDVVDRQELLAKLYQISKGKRCTMLDEYNRDLKKYSVIPLQMLRHFWEQEEKKRVNRYDNQDLALQYIKEGVPPAFKYLFIDEAQDLSNLQWAVVQKIIPSVTDTTYLAGDDDQAIYGFAGAQAETFLNFPCDEEIVLDTNYRNPSNVFALGYENVENIAVRKSKQIRTIKPPTPIDYIKTIDSIDFELFNPQDDKTLPTVCFLGRTKRIVWAMEQDLRAKGIYFTTQFGKPSHKMYEKIDVLYASAYVAPTSNICTNTFHKVKGGEYDYVICNLSFTNSHNVSNDERRLLYVAMTRAKKKLILLEP